MLHLLGSFLMGLAIGVAIDQLWTKTSINKYERRLELLEHYHWGLVILMLARLLHTFSKLTLSGAGLASIFILLEVVQEHPFAFRSDHQVSSTIVGILLLAVLMLVWVRL
jgi:hypothetical protein